MKADAILYTSNTGFTRRYAQMLGERTGLPVCDIKGRDVPAPGSKVIYLGWVMAGGVKGLNKARKKWEVAAVCAVGMAPEGMIEREGVKDKCALPAGVPFFYLQGGYDPKKMTGIYKPMMSMMAKQVTKNPPKDDVEAGMQEAFRHGCDFVDEKHLAPILAWLETGG